MNNESIRLHPEHGLNPFIPKCYICGEDHNMICLPGAACESDANQTLHGKVISKEPCGACKKHMEKGVFFIETTEESEHHPDQEPYRTGKYWLIKREAVAKVLTDPDEVLYRGAVFITKKRAEQLGFYQHNNEEPEEPEYNSRGEQNER